jgi:tRNA pseudouridine13 synthase
MGITRLKMKCKPGDFTVDEVTEIPMDPEGEFAVYRLKKEGWNTVDVLREVSRQYSLSPALLAYGGKKDRYGATSQAVTIRNRRNLSFTDKHYSLELLGFSRRPMGPHFIKGNRFVIVVRDLKSEDAQRAVQGADAVRRDGLPNYFDDQRFGGLDPDHGFLGEKILKRHWNGALKCALLSIHHEDKKEEKQRKRTLGLNWRDWKACRQAARTRLERQVFDALLRDPRSSPRLLEGVAREDLHMAASAYQSHLWNEMTRRLFRAKKMTGLLTYPGAAGDYLFYDRLPEKDRKYFLSLTVPLMAAKAKIPDTLTRKVYEELLSGESIGPSLLNRIKVRQVEFSPVLRAVILQPEDLSFSTDKDDLYPGKTKLTISFRLPRGAYGTMVVKRFFAESSAS